MEARAGGAVPRLVGFLYTSAKLVPVERFTLCFLLVRYPEACFGSQLHSNAPQLAAGFFTSRRCNGAECLISANSSFEGTRTLRPRGLLRQPASDWRYCGRSPRLSPFVPAPTGKRRISCLYGAPDCQIKWVVFLTGIGTIIECKPLMPS